MTIKESLVLMTQYDSHTTKITTTTTSTCTNPSIDVTDTYNTTITTSSSTGSASCCSNEENKELIPYHNSTIHHNSQSQLFESEDNIEETNANNNQDGSVHAIATTEFQTFLHILKGNVGPGCLSLPWAISQLTFTQGDNNNNNNNGNNEDNNSNNQTNSTSVDNSYDINNYTTTETTNHSSILFYGTVAICFMSYWSCYNCWTIVKLKRYIVQQSEQQQEKLEAEEVQQQQNNINYDNRTTEKRLSVDTVPATTTTTNNMIDPLAPDVGSTSIRRAVDNPCIHENSSNNNNNPSTNFSIHNNTTSINQIVTFPDLGDWAYGTQFRNFVMTCICIQQLAVCTVFFSFIGENLSAAISSLTTTATSSSSSSSSQKTAINHVTVMTMCLPCIIVLSCIKSLKQLSPIVGIGTILLFSTFAILLYIIILVQIHHQAHDGEHETPEIENEFVSIQELVPTTTTVTTTTNNESTTSTLYSMFSCYSQISLGLCAILYSFEGICLMLPIESVMKQSYQRFGIVYTISMSVVTILLILVATLCVSTFGIVSNGSITAFLIQSYQHLLLTASTTTSHNSEHDEEYFYSYILMWLHSANAAVSLSVLFTYPLQLFPVIEVLGPVTVQTQIKLRRMLFSSFSYTYCCSNNKRLYNTVEQDDNNDVNERNNGEEEMITSSIRQKQQEQQEEDISMIRSSSTTTTATTLPTLQLPTGVTSSANTIIIPIDNENMNGTNISSSSSMIVGDTNLLRTILILITYLVAVLIPNVQALITVAGAIAGSSIALLIPPLLELAYINELDMIDMDNDEIENEQNNTNTNNEQQDQQQPNVLLYHSNQSSNNTPVPYQRCNNYDNQETRSSRHYRHRRRRRQLHNNQQQPSNQQQQEENNWLHTSSSHSTTTSSSSIASGATSGSSTSYYWYYYQWKLRFGGKRWYEKNKCYLLLVGGIIFGLIGTIASVIDIVQLILQQSTK